MDNRTFYIILISAAVLAVPAALLMHEIFFIEARYEYDMFLTVSDATGVNVASDAIYFGSVKPGDSVTRIISISTIDAREIVLKSKSDFEGWVFYETPVVVGSGDAKNISISAAVPNGAPHGEYHGKLNVIVYK